MRPRSRIVKPAVAEESDTICDVYEPYLLQEGVITRRANSRHPVVQVTVAISANALGNRESVQSEPRTAIAQLFNGTEDFQRRLDYLHQGLRQIERTCRSGDELFARCGCSTHGSRRRHRRLPRFGV